MYLHSNSTQILALKNWFFSFFRTQKKFFKFFYQIVMQIFSADAKVFSKKLKRKFLTPKKWKNGPQKLLIIGPDPFISQFSPDHSPKPRIDFSYYEISGPDICSLTCDLDNSDEPEPKPGLKLNNFQLSSARDLFHSARKFPYLGSKFSLIS